MARINIEERWWSDPRRMKLVMAIGFAADSAAVNLWRTAQEYWKKQRGLVPRQIFDSVEFSSDLVRCGLAEDRGEWVYVRGSSDYLDWTREKREQAAAAGKKSAESRKQKSGSAQPSGGRGSKPANKVNKQPNENRTESNGTEPSGSVSGSYSVSSSESDSVISFSSENDRSAAEIVEEIPQGKKTQALIGKYCELWRERYNSSPPILGKDAGIAKRVAKELSQDKINLYLEAFFQMPDSWLVKVKHPLAQFEHKINEIAVFAESGQFTTRTEVNQIDRGAAQLSQVERIRKGIL